MKRMSIFVALLLVIANGSYLQAQGALHRLAANFTRFDGVENSTTNLPLNNATGGLQFYTHKVTVPAGDNTLYVTISGTTDVHSFTGGINGLFLSCAIGANACNSGFGSNGSPTGWVLVHRNDQDHHDNSFYATWCAVTAPGQRTVKIRMASLTGEDVFIEQVHVYIDSSNVTAGIGTQCVQDNAGPSPTLSQ